MTTQYPPTGIGDFHILVDLSMASVVDVERHIAGMVDDITIVVVRSAIFSITGFGLVAAVNTYA